MEWTEELIARLRGLWDEGHSTAEIGRRLGVSKNAVVGKAHRLNLPARPSPIRRDANSQLPRTRRIARGPTLPPLKAASLADHGARLASRAPVSPAGAGFAGAPASAADRAGAAPAGSVAPAPRPYARSIACCWPLGEPGTSGFHFCGLDALPGKPYCAQHAQLAYVRVRDRRDDAA
ncbi:MAG TPA: GcrA family cell cycle regulator [Acetobacteraceae bacterium]|jgi:GcrA cell cycle regulator|nr:GcrA family cell cycle regulator [Acetobacteraceae bacterium]